MRNKYNEQLEQLNHDIIAMGELVEVAIQSSILSLMSRDTEEAKIISKNDDVIDAKERDIEQACLKILLQQQPVAKDLRFVTSALKIVTDLERIGDHAANIAEMILELPDCNCDSISDLHDMAQDVIEMVHSSIISYVERNYSSAVDVIVRDDAVDERYHNIKKNLINKIRDSSNGEQNTEYLMIAKYLERIGDHATNIAEWTKFAITGDIKEPQKND